MSTQFIARFVWLNQIGEWCAHMEKSLAIRLLSSHIFWQLLALLMPLLIIIGHFAAYKPSHDPLSIAITVLAQAAVTWPLHVIPAFLIAKGFKAYRTLSSDIRVTKIALYWASSLTVYGVGYVYWHRFWYRSIFALAA